MTIPTDETAPGPGRHTGPKPGSWRDLFGEGRLPVVLVMAGGVLLYAMNLYFTAALMPSIATELAGERYYAWVTTGFVMAAIIASMLVSRLLGSRGARTAYLVAFVAFAAGAVVVAVSPTMELLVAGRVVQGLGGGLLAGLGYAVIRAALPDRLWARGVGLISAMWGIGTLLGPVLGGVFAQFGAWRIAYFAVVAAAVLLAVLTPIALRRGSAGQGRSPLPVASLGILVAATAAISLSSVLEVGWPTALTIGIGIVLLVAFVLVERRATATVLPAITYQAGNPLKWIYLTVAVLCGGVMTENFIPLFGQGLGGLTPVLAGILGAILSAAWTIVQLIVVSVERESARRRAMRLGPLLLTIGLVGYASLQVPGASAFVMVGWVVALALCGVGIGLAWPLLQVQALRASGDPAEGGKAAAGISTTQLIAFSITSALGGSLVALGGESLAASARYLVLGMSALAVVGVVTAIRATSRSQG